MDFSPFIGKRPIGEIKFGARRVVAGGRPSGLVRGCLAELIQMTALSSQKMPLYGNV